MPKPTEMTAPSRHRRLYLIVELVTVFIGLPIVFWLGLLPLHVLVTLWLVTFGCLAILFRDPDFESRRLWNARPLVAELPRILGLFVPLASILAAIVVLTAPELLFGFVRERPRLWALVMVLYPLFSVYPQGLVFRVFLFHRYRPLFASGSSRILASSLAFGFMHIVFDNWIAVGLTVVGGALFATTYHRSGSALAASVEHALYGCFIITLGLGRFVYSG